MKVKENIHNNKNPSIHLNQRYSINSILSCNYLSKASQNCYDLSVCLEMLNNQFFFFQKLQQGGNLTVPNTKKRVDTHCHGFFFGKRVIFPIYLKALRTNTITLSSTQLKEFPSSLRVMTP